MSSKLEKEIDLLMGLPYEDFEKHIIGQIFDVMTPSEISEMMNQMPDEPFTKKLQSIIGEKREEKINQIINKK